MKIINLFEELNPKGLEISTLLGDYSTEKGIFNEVDMDFMKENQDRRFMEIENNCEFVTQEYYSPLIVEVIKEIIEGGEYAYNKTVQDKVKEKYGLEGEGLNWIVYYSQGYASLVTAIKNAVKKATELIEQGFYPLVDRDGNTGKRFRLIAPVTVGFLGQSGIKETKPHTLIKDAAGMFYFIARSNSRKGIFASKNIYVKSI